jgi:hypothetical protein
VQATGHDRRDAGQIGQGDVRVARVRLGRVAALLAVAQKLILLERRAERGSPKALAVEANKTMRLITDDVRDLGLPPMDASTPVEELWPTAQALGRNWMGAWSVGQWPTGPVMPPGITDGLPNASTPRRRPQSP